jgi:DNA-binding transcriptional regulator YiaG
MTWDVFKKMLDEANLSQREFARIIKASHSAVNKWRLQPEVPGYAEVIAILLANDPKRMREL